MKFLKWRLVPYFWPFQMAIPGNNTWKMFCIAKETLLCNRIWINIFICIAFRQSTFHCRAMFCLLNSANKRPPISPCNCCFHLCVWGKFHKQLSLSHSKILLPVMIFCFKSLRSHFLSEERRLQILYDYVIFKTINLAQSWASMVAQRVKNLPVRWNGRVCTLHQEDPLEKGIETHSSILAWRIPWIEEPVQSMGLQRVEHV